MAEAAPDPLSARARLVVAAVLAFGIASLQGLWLLPAVAGLAALVVALQRRPRRLLRRLRPAALLALGLLLALALLSAGRPVAAFGALTVTAEGVQAGVLVAVRLITVVALTLALLAPVTPFRLVAGLRSLGLPGLMADLALLTLRYVEELTAELARAERARRLRGGRSRWRDLPDQAMLVATALIRAQGRADRLWAAMRVRGHGAAAGSDARAVPAPAAGVCDRAAMAGAVVLALGLVALDRGL